MYFGISQNMQNTLKSVFDWVSTHLSMLLGIVVILVFAAMLSRFLCHVFARLLAQTVREDMFPTKTDRDKRYRTLNSISNAIINFIVWSVAFVIVLGRLGINTAPLLASAGILGVALGFGAQSLVKDFITGMFIIAENQYRVGDYVEIQNIRGTVKAVTMRTTVIQDDDGSVFHIPNGSIIVTGNHTMNNSKLSLELAASTDTDIDRLREIINKIGKQIAAQTELKDLIVEPLQFERIKNIRSGVVNMRVSGKVKAGKQIVVKSAFYEALQTEMVKNKIALK